MAWVPGSRSKCGNWTTVPSLYSWNIAECDVKPQQSYKPNQNCFSLGTFDFSQLFWWALCRLCHYVPFETAWITAYYFSDIYQQKQLVVFHLHTRVVIMAGVVSLCVVGADETLQNRPIAVRVQIGSLQLSSSTKWILGYCIYIKNRSTVINILSWYTIFYVKICFNDGLCNIIKILFC